MSRRDEQKVESNTTNLLMATVDAVSVMASELARISAGYDHETKGSKDVRHDATKCLPCRAQMAIDIAMDGINQIKKTPEGEANGSSIIIL